MVRIGFIASQEMSFENVDDAGQTADALLYCKLTYELANYSFGDISFKDLNLILYRDFNLIFKRDITQQ